MSISIDILLKIIEAFRTKSTVTMPTSESRIDQFALIQILRIHRLGY
ncbi:MAG: hypothetical protein GW809_03790 [Bacteroidetes bacterium]|nr:hypothetical protein [Bacteroidota bacterium]